MSLTDTLICVIIRLGSETPITYENTIMSLIKEYLHWIQEEQQEEVFQHLLLEIEEENASGEEELKVPPTQRL